MSYGSPRWSYELLDCAMPVTFDTYSNCSHKCLYCFSAYQRQSEIQSTAAHYRNNIVSAVNVEQVQQLFTLKCPSQFSQWIAERRVIQWGGLSDMFDYTERERGVTLKLLRFFRELNYPISLSTKATWFLSDPRYLEVLSGYTNLHVKVSIITADDYMARKIEPGVPSATERIESLARWRALGVGGVTLRFRPFILGCGDLTASQLVEASARAGADSVTSEFLCIEGRASPILKQRYAVISAAVGYDVLEFYLKHSQGTGLLRLNYELKRKYFEALRDHVHSLGMRFYVSDAHHKNLSDGYNCCGAPHIGELASGNTGNFMGALLLAKQKGYVTWNDILPQAAWMQELPYVGLQGYNQANSKNRARRQHQTMLDYMQERWNNTKAANSPQHYFGGVLLAGDVDDSGNVIYYYNRPLVEQGRHIKSVKELREELGL